MRAAPSLVRNLRPPVFSLMLVFLLSHCGAGGVLIGTSEYTIAWRWVNNSATAVTFTRSDANAFGPPAGPPSTVSAGGSANELSDGETDKETTSVSVIIRENGQQKAIQSLDVPVADQQTTTVTAVWNGTQLSLTHSGGVLCAPPQLALGASAAVCTPPIWKLDGITGNASGNWSDLAGTGSGTLTVSFPQEVKQGEAYHLSATFSGSLTYNLGWEMTQRNISVSICDRSGLSNVCGLAATSTQQLARGAASGSITWTGPWTVTSSYPATFTLEAAAAFTIQGTSPLLVATYSKQP